MAQSPHFTVVDATGNPISATTPLSVAFGISGTDTTNSATVGPNTATSATLPAVANKTTYLTGFSVTVGGGAGAATGLVTVTGTVGGTLNYQVAGEPTGVHCDHTFPRAIPASAANTAITVNVPALGATTGSVACSIYGYHL